ncbi:MAG: CCA tRNA nucleotidyltransferase [Rickettsiales bacterium]|nr:CCA tRNA nucleotidyltransferase [Rickettsiales bacterium]
MHIQNRKIFTEEVYHILDILLDDGDEARLVGGCVRDFLLGKKINDFDIATERRPEEVLEKLKKNNVKYLTNGLKFGSITAVIGDEKFEITTLRRDIKGSGRFPVVEFINDYAEDAIRRDFTFNALYMGYDGTIYDYLGGKKDLEKGIIRFIGNPRIRILEDSLRILRFFRFFGSCATQMDYEGFCNCIRYKSLISTLSKSRVKSEYIKILRSPGGTKILKIMEAYGINPILPINYCQNA